MRILQQSSTARALVFLMVDDTDHVTGKTGLSPTVTIRKEGGSFASPAGAVSEIANGWYQVAGNATDTGTLGTLLLHAEASGADPVDMEFEVVAFDPLSTTLGSALASAAGLATVAGYLDTEVGAILAVANKLDGMLVADGEVYQFTANAMELAPVSNAEAPNIEVHITEIRSSS